MICPDRQGRLRAHLFLPLTLLVLAASGIAAACSPPEDKSAQIQPGLSRAEVKEILGEPDEVNNAVLPNGAFFGPQESLLGLLEAGASYEEWLYHFGDDDFYVWFAGESGNSDGWTVILTGRYPRDAIY